MAKAAAVIEKKHALSSLFCRHKDMGSLYPAAADGVVRDPVHFAVETIFRITVWKHKIFCAGGNGKTHPVAGFEGVGELCGSNAHLIDAIRFHKFRFFKAVSVFYIHDAVRQLNGDSVFIHIRDPHE